MASEWEELERLTKEELIIELVRERNLRRRSNRAIRWVVDLDYPEDRRLPVYADEEEEVRTDDSWVEAIAEYAARVAGVDDFTPYTLEDYGLGEEDSRKGYVHLRRKGIITDDRYDEEDMA